MTVAMIATLCVGSCVAQTLPAVAPGTRACLGLPSEQCEEIFRQADETARQRGTVVVGIVVRCTDVCSQASGEGESSVTFGDGTSEGYGFGWHAAEPVPVVGTPGPEPTLSVIPTCVGLDATLCESRALESVGVPAPGDGEIVSIVIRCTPGPCTNAKGEGETTITFADGQVRMTHWIYSGSP